MKSLKFVESSLGSPCLITLNANQAVSVNAKGDMKSRLNLDYFGGTLIYTEIEHQTLFVNYHLPSASVFLQHLPGHITPIICQAIIHPNSNHTR